MRRRASLAIAAVLGVLVAPSAARAGGTTAPGANGLLAFAYHNQVYSIAPSGAGRHQLTGTGKNYRPSWSPDGTRLAYIHEDGNGSRDIWVMRADGSGQQQVSTGHTVTGGPSWSPDGKRLVFTDRYVYAITLATRQVTALEACFDQDSDFTKYPLGTPCQPGQTQEPLTSVGPPAWSSDGKYIALTAVGGVYDELVELWSGNGNSIHIAAVDGGGGSYGYYGSTYSWAPDSRSFLVAHSGSARPGMIATFAVPASGHPTRVVSVRGDDEPAYSPDGRRFAVTNASAGSPQIYVSNLDGTHCRMVVAGYQPAWQAR